MRKTFCLLSFCLLANLIVLAQDSQPLDLKFYPNPFQDQLSIDLQSLSPVEGELLVLELMDATGRPTGLVARLRAGQNVIRTDLISAGIYLYRLSQNGRVLKTGKLIKQG